MASLMRNTRPTARVRGAASAPVPMKQYPCSGVTLYAGELVSLDANGLVQRARAANNVLDTGSYKIIGVLAHDVDSTKTVCNVILAEANVEFSAPIYHSTAASAVTANSQVGDKYQLRNFTGNIPCVDLENNTNPHAIITGIDTAWAVGTQYGRVWWSCLSAGYQLAQGV